MNGSSSHHAQINTQNPLFCKEFMANLIYLALTVTISNI